MARKFVDEIRSSLSAMESAWNEGDLETFMSFYCKGPSTTMTIPERRIVGWEKIKEYYAQRESIGIVRLKLHVARVFTMPRHYGYVQGEAWFISQNRETLTLVSLLMICEDRGQWVIAHDHST